nr:hypothetical protein [uncultured Sphaerochaeta sp.]
MGIVLSLVYHCKQGVAMGRRQLLEKHCRGSHFTWGERLKLQYYYAGSSRKERRPLCWARYSRRAEKLSAES